MFQASLLYPPFLPIANTCRNLRHVIPLWALGHKGAIVMLCSEIQIYRNMEFSLEADRNLLNEEIDLSSYSHRDSVTYNDLAIVTRGTVACRKKNIYTKGESGFGQPMHYTFPFSNLREHHLKFEMKKKLVHWSHAKLSTTKVHRITEYLWNFNKTLSCKCSADTSIG